jgi:hypothetical protein
MTTDNKYNGWTNYATWRVNLEMCDDLCPDDFNLEEGEDMELVDAYELAEALKERCEYYVLEEAKGFARDYALAFMSDVNWHEIATHFINNYKD